MLRLIRNRAALVLAGLVAVLCPMLMAPSGGFPYRPTFGAVTVNNGPIAGSVVATNTVAGTSQRALVSTNSGAGAAVDNAIQQSNDASNTVYLGVTSSTYSGAEWTNAPTGPQAFLGSSGNFPLCMANNNTARICLSSAVAGEQFRVIGSAAAGAAISYFGFYDNAGARQGYFGKTSGVNSHLVWESDAGNLRMIPLASTGKVEVSNDGGATWVSLMPLSGTYTGTFNADCTTSPTVTVHYQVVGNLVTLEIPTQSCTSNVTSFTISGAPAAVSPATSCGYMFPVSQMQDNGAGVAAQGCMSSAGQLTFGKVAAGFGLNNWTASGTKGIGDTTRGVVIQYSLD